MQQELRRWIRLVESEVTPQLTCFCDCDGVLADFNGHVQTLFGTDPDRMPETALWQAIDSVPDFYLTIPLKADARQLWNAIKPFHPIILTGCPAHNYDESARQKVIWIKRHFGDVEVITCLSRNKPLSMNAPGDILIDDRSGNIKKWIKAGGIGILHTNAASTIAKFQDIIHNRSIA
jgi:hypothetical protein